MAAWAEADDVIDAWIGDDAPSDLTKVGVWVDRAERLVRKQVPGLQARLDADPPEEDLADTIRDVIVNMVTRVFRNPSGERQRAETTGPFTESVTYGGDNPGALHITDAELDQLRGGASTGGRAFMVDTLGADYKLPWHGWAADDAW